MRISPDELRALLSVAKEFGLTELSLDGGFCAKFHVQQGEIPEIPGSEIPNDEEMLYASSGFPIEKAKAD